MDADADRPDGSLLADVSGSARGWHGVQLAVLAFIGLCGVLGDSDAGTPRWLQILAGVLAIVALALSCLSIFLVATVAWPFPRRGEGRVDPVTAASRLRTGVLLTYLAVAVMALAASSSWWPTPASTSGDSEDGIGATVQVTDSSGRTACGELVDGPAGRIRLATSAGTVEVATTGVADISPVDAC